MERRHPTSCVVNGRPNANLGIQLPRIGRGFVCHGYKTLTGSEKYKSCKIDFCRAMLETLLPATRYSGLSQSYLMGTNYSAQASASECKWRLFHEYEIGDSLRLSIVVLWLVSWIPNAYKLVGHLLTSSMCHWEYRCGHRPRDEHHEGVPILGAFWPCVSENSPLSTCSHHLVD